MPDDQTLHQIKPGEGKARLVRYADLVPCRNAFIDTRNPGSEEKENFTIIGPGVSENPEQFVHVQEPHGFNIGAARQPPHCVNSQHSHDTAEVFVVFSGQWTFNFGENGEVKVPVEPGSVASIPTHLFRGFSNVGTETGFLWVALGSDDPGRVLWAPKVFDMAQDFGLVLMDDGSLFDTIRDGSVPVGAKLMPRTSADQVAALTPPSAQLAAKCIIAPNEMKDQPPGLLNRSGVDERLLIGPRAKIEWPHGFTLSRVMLPSGSRIDSYAHQEKEVWFVASGSLDFLAGDQSLAMGPGDTLSVPQLLKRSWNSKEATVAFVVRGGDRLPDLIH